MIKVLWYSDFLIQTGFGNVAEEILLRLYATKKYDFTVLGINYFGEPYNTIESPYYHLRDIIVHPAEYNKDPLGSEKLINFLKKDRYDILFVLQDVFNMSPLSDTLRTIRAEKGFKYIFYFPVDGPMEAEWVHRGIKIADYPVAYTEYGVSETHKHDPKLSLDIILHGVDTDVFYPLTNSERSTFRRQYFGAEPDEFVVTNVNRNQVRKDIPRTIMTWVQLKKKVPKSKLYLHMHIREQVGYDIPLLIKKLVPVNWRNDVICPNPASFGLHGFSKETLRKIYGASDVVISTTLGEGFGLCLDRKTKVWSKNGLKNLESISLSDEVLSGDGKFHSVKNISSRNYNGVLYKFKTWKGHNWIKSSDNHKFMIEGGSWKMAKELKVGDKLLFPKIKEGTDKVFDDEDTGDYIVYPIKYLKTEQVFDYSLMDIQVEDSHNFVAENVIAHNSTIESAACKTPIVMPRHTSLIEIIGANEERGYLADCSNFNILQNHDGYRVRPLTDIDSLAEKIIHIYENPVEAKEKVNAAFAWIKENCNWDKIVEKWDEIFESATKGD